MLEAQAPAGEQSNPYLPAGPPDPMICEEFDGVNTSTSRPGVADKEVYWSSGFLQIGPRLFRVLPGVGGAIYTAPPTKTIAFFDFSNIGATAYCIIVLNDGSINALNMSSNTVVQLGVPGSVATPAENQVAIAGYGDQYIIIVANQLAGYWLWDGVTFYVPGATGPDSKPLPTDVGGSTVEVYTQRVWVARGATIFYSAPGSPDNFGDSGAGNFTSPDSFLRVGFTALVQTNGFLYTVADSSVNYISGVTTSGDPPVTTFTNQNVDPENGTPYGNSVLVFGRNIVFANSFGVHVVYGAAATKISENLDGVYNTVPNFNGLALSASKATIFGKKCWILLAPVVDPVTGSSAPKLFLWNGKKWFPTDQDMNLLNVRAQEIGSVLTAYGTDGFVIRPLFQNASTKFLKTMQSRLRDAPGGYQFYKSPSRFWGVVQYYSTAAPEITVQIDNEDYTASVSPTYSFAPGGVQWLDANGNDVNWVDALGNGVFWALQGSGIFVFPPTAIGQTGTFTGFTLQTSAADLGLISFSIQDEIPAYRG